MKTVQISLNSIEKVKSFVNDICKFDNDFDLEYMTRKQLTAFLPVISGARMLQDYIDYLFPV